MKISCDVMKDILPLYAEGLASEDTAVLAEEHLASCETCQKALLELRAPATLPADTDAAPLRKIRSRLQTQKAWTIALTVLVCLAVAVTAFGWLTSPEYLPYSDKTVSLTAHEKDMLSVRFGGDVSGYTIYKTPSETGGGDTIFITAWSSALSRLNGGQDANEVILNPNGESVANVYYYKAYGEGNELLYGKGMSGHTVILPRLFLAYYIVFAAVLAVLLLAATLLLRRHRKAQKVLWRITLLPVSYLFAHLCIKGTYAPTYTPVRDLFLISLVTLLLYGVLLVVYGILIKRRSGEKRTKP